MNPLHDLSIGNPPEEVNVLIEIAKGSSNKYELDKETGLLRLDRVLYSAVFYPMDYGLVPQTYWHDGDSLDAFILSTYPFVPGSIVPSRPIALLKMVDAGERDEKLICVPVDDPRFAQYQDVGDIPDHTVTELKNFFETYKILQKKKVVVEGVDGKQAAIDAIAEGQKLYKEKFGK